MRYLGGMTSEFMRALFWAAENGCVSASKDVTHEEHASRQKHRSKSFVSPACQGNQTSINSEKLPGRRAYPQTSRCPCFWQSSSAVLRHDPPTPMMHWTPRGNYASNRFEQANHFRLFLFAAVWSRGTLDKGEEIRNYAVDCQMCRGIAARTLGAKHHWCKCTPSKTSLI